MTVTPMPSDASPERASRFLPVLLLLFAGSGCSALIYEIVWYQLLQFAIGSTAVSLGFLLATFMGGLGLGSWLLPRMFRKIDGGRNHPLRLYALIEAGIAACALLELVLIPLINGAYVAGFRSGLSNEILRGILCAIVLLPPTVLMGASLPAIARWAQATPRGVTWWGKFYGVNTLGAVSGCLLAGFFLMPFTDIYIATLAGVAINLGVAVLSWILAKATPHTAAGEGEDEDEDSRPAPSADAPVARRLDIWPIYIGVFMSGAVAIGAQIVWTRVLSLLFAGTTYAFSIMLAVFLSGLALGAWIASRAIQRFDPRQALGWAQFLAVLGLGWTAFHITVNVPFWPIVSTWQPNPLITFQLDALRTFFCIFPATVAWGASVPLAFAAASRLRSEDPGRTVAGVYAANTAGAIIGALAVSLWLVPAIGTQGTQRVLMAFAALSGLVVLAPVAIRSANWVDGAGMASVSVLAAALIVGVHPTPPELISYGRRIIQFVGTSQYLEVREGRNSSIAISQYSDGSLQFHVAGKVEASNNPDDFRLQRMLGHIPALVGDPKSVLVVGFGAGVTAGAFTRYPGIASITICEMEPLVPPTSTRWFSRENYNVLHHPRTRMVYDDGRHFVLTTKDKYDLITSDPIHPFVKGSANLYTQEYFEMVRDRLNPGGVVTQWIPLYESDVATVKSEIATFFEVFPHGAIFANLAGGQGYDVVALGSMEPLNIDLDAIQRRLETPAYALVAQSMRDVQMGSVTDLLRTFTATREDLAPWMADGLINRDRNLRLQYVAGKALNVGIQDSILREMLAYRRGDASMFTGAPEKLAAIAEGYPGM
jgi:spermidine synthase